MTGSRWASALGAMALLGACLAAAGAEWRPTVSLSKTVSVRLTNRPLRELVDALRAQVAPVIVADAETLDRRVTVFAEQAPAWWVLDAAAEQATAFWWVDDGALLLSDSVGGDDEAEDPLRATELAAEGTLAFLASLDGPQRQTLLAGQALDWKSMAKLQTEVVGSLAKRLSLPFFEVNYKTGHHAVALIADPYVEYARPGKPSVRSYFRWRRALESLMTTRLREDGRAFGPIAPVQRVKALPRPAEPPVAKPADDDGQEAPRELTLAGLCKAAFPGAAGRRRAAAYARRKVVVFAPRRELDARWLAQRGIACLGARESPDRADRALVVPWFELIERPGDDSFAPLVGIPRAAVTEALRPFIEGVDFEAEGCPFPAADFLQGARFRSDALDARRLAFLTAQVPKERAEGLIDPATARLWPCEVRLGTSVLLGILGYVQDRVAGHRFGAQHNVIGQIQADYGERLPKVRLRLQPEPAEEF